MTDKPRAGVVRRGRRKSRENARNRGKQLKSDKNRGKFAAKSRHQIP